MNRGSVQAEMDMDMVAELEPESESQSVQEGQDQDPNDVATAGATASALGSESGADMVVMALALENFPEEILSVIWKLLPTSDLLSTRLACKRWATLIHLPRGILGMDENRATLQLQLLTRAIFRKIDTLIVQNCQMTELPIHVDTKEVIPSYVRCLEIGGSFNSPQGVQAVMDQYCDQMQEFVVKDCALAVFDIDAGNRWKFQNLKHLKIDLVPSPSGCWNTRLFTPEIFESHMETLEELFKKDYPKLEVVSAVFEAANQWQHSHYNVALVLSCLREFGDFLRRNMTKTKSNGTKTTKIKKLEVQEIVSGKQILGRLQNGLVQVVNLVSCTIDMERLWGRRGVPPFDVKHHETASNKLNRFEAWVNAVPEGDMSMSYRLQYTSNYPGADVERVPVDLKIIVEPISLYRRLIAALNVNDFWDFE